MASEINFTIKIEYASNTADRESAKENVRNKVASGLQKLFQTSVEVSAKDTKTGLSLEVNAPDSCKYTVKYCLDHRLVLRNLNLPQNYRASIVRQG